MLKRKKLPMDKNTLSRYGWIVVIALIFVVILLFYRHRF